MEQEFEEQLTGQATPAPSAPALSLLHEPSASFLPLPSKGILYKNIPDLMDVKDGQISVRPMTLKELEMFLKPDLTETGTLIDAVLANCIKSKINPKQLLSSDRMFILIWMRVNSFGSNYRFRFKCSDCRKTNSTKIDLSNLPVYTLDKIHGGDAPTKNSIAKIKEPFIAELPFSKVKVHFRLVRGYDESAQASDQYYKRQDRDQKRNKAIHRREDGVTVIRNIDPRDQQEQETETMIDETDVASISDRLLRQITSIEGIEKAQYETVLGNMVAGDITSLQEMMLMADSGYDTNLMVKCANPDCGFDNKFNMPLQESFFRSSL